MNQQMQGDRARGETIAPKESDGMKSTAWARSPAGTNRGRQRGSPAANASARQGEEGQSYEQMLVEGMTRQPAG